MFYPFKKKGEGGGGSFEAVSIRGFSHAEGGRGGGGVTESFHSIQRGGGAKDFTLSRRGVTAKVQTRDFPILFPTPTSP